MIWDFDCRKSIRLFRDFTLYRTVLLSKSYFLVKLRRVYRSESISSLSFVSGLCEGSCVWAAAADCLALSIAYKKCLRRASAQFFVESRASASLFSTSDYRIFLFSLSSYRMAKLISRSSCLVASCS